MRRTRIVTDVLPDEVAVHDGLSYSLWLPKRPARPHGGVLILHGAGSCKESHHDFARAAQAAGFAALSFDQRGHGESEGSLDGRALDDVGEMARLLRLRIAELGAAEVPVPIALRGSSMGGMFSILAAGVAGAAAVVAICPASPAGMRRLVGGEELYFRADRGELDALLEAADLTATVEQLDARLLLLHAEGDEQVPVEHSRELANHMSGDGGRLVTLPGGHHRSIQHDPELQALSLRFIEQAFGVRRR